jgi:BirA family biotin operon repressor/biotin-[acetyl-CoA-carboxylase] ligase
MTKLISRIHLPVIDSTNTWAKVNIPQIDAEKITLVTADMQTEGRGRLNRQWISPEQQNVYATFCFFVEKGTPPLFNISQILAISACKTLEELAFKPKLKWPNDLLINHKKVGGILCETVFLENSICVIAGIGINVNMPQKTAEAIGQPATSLLIEGGKKISIDNVITTLASHFSRDLAHFLEAGFSPFLVDYTARFVHTAKQKLQLSEKDVVWKGSFHSLNPDGSLNLFLDTGEIKRFYSGDLA